MSAAAQGAYPLATDPRELERLRFQHEVWGPTTRAFLARTGVGAGARVVDLGCGPGFVALELAELVGEGGHVLAVDESPSWTAHLGREAAGLPQVEVRRARIEELELEEGSCDLVFARWVFSFLADPAAVVRRLARALRPGGLLAIEDYNHEGVSLFPPSEGFRAAVRATRALYARAGGDAFVAGRAPALFAAAGLETASIVPNALCGGPSSPVFRWAGLFFPHYSARLEELGLMSAAERERFLREWAERERDPDALFFSPYVVDCLARRPR